MSIEDMQVPDEIEEAFAESYDFSTRDRLTRRAPTAHVLVGLPRCGKSTWANEHRDMLRAAIIGGDDVRRALGVDRFLAPLEPIVASTVYYAARAMLIRGQNVIVDETNHTRAARRVWVAIAQEGLAEVVFVKIARPSEVEEWRDRARKADFPWGIIVRHMKEFEPLGNDELEHGSIVIGSLE